ncbi:SCO2322 family protein [Streptomyces aureoversilis]|uniref:SCO2322 family protein n=1 Tax=Streptomyces aureoversilis TaxID=67277 RepID=A0ABV9ZRJ1_9ACTN
MTRAAAARGVVTRGGAVAALAAVLLTLLGTAPAQASGYRYWSFWQGSGGQWAYATQGPATARPGDGEAVGFRFAVSADSSDAAKPRAAAGFAAVCDGTPAKDGTKRVAVVLDFGTAADAPKGETPPAARSACAQVGEDATAGEALAAVAKPLRYDSSALLCAIAGYPRTGCGEQVGGARKDSPDGSAQPGPAASEGSDGAGSGDGGGPSAGLIGGIAAVVVLGAAAVWQARRRRG